jgi:hypothetical protein
MITLFRLLTVSNFWRGHKYWVCSTLPQRSDTDDLRTEVQVGSGSTGDCIHTISFI